MKLIFAAFLSLFLLQASAQSVINDPNVEVRPVPKFEALDVSSGIDVILSKGNEQVVAVSASKESIRDRIITKVENGVLKVRYENNEPRIRINEKLRVYISYTTLRSLEASGACDVTFAENFVAKDFRLKLSGASSMKSSIDITNLSADLSGASTANLNGTVQNIRIEASGASDLKGYELNAAHCVAKISGASDIKIYVSNSIKVNASGASNFYYKGEPDTKDIASTGASTVAKK